MTKVEALEEQVKCLSEDELRDFRNWFSEYLAKEWDQQIEADIQAGKLDSLAEKALRYHQEGRTEEL